MATLRTAVAWFLLVFSSDVSSGTSYQICIITTIVVPSILSKIS